MHYNGAFASIDVLTEADGWTIWRKMANYMKIGFSQQACPQRWNHQFTRAVTVKTIEFTTM